METDGLHLGSLETCAQVVIKFSKEVTKVGEVLPFEESCAVPASNSWCSYSVSLTVLLKSRSPGAPVSPSGSMKCPGTTTISSRLPMRRCASRYRQVGAGRVRASWKRGRTWPSGRRQTRLQSRVALPAATKFGKQR